MLLQFHGAWEHICFTKEVFFFTKPQFVGIGASKALPRRALGRSGGGVVNGVDYFKMRCFEEALSIDPADADSWRALVESGGGVVPL